MQERVKSAEIVTPGGLRVVDSSDSTGSLPVALKRDSPQLKITRHDGLLFRYRIGEGLPTTRPESFVPLRSGELRSQGCRVYEFPLIGRYPG
jgi:hypothetical protein